MASRNPQTAARQAHEQALKERRERERAKKAEVAAGVAAAKHAPPAEVSDDGNSPPLASAEPNAPLEQRRSMKSAPIVAGAARAHPRLAVGDLVVYASHGVGRVEARRPGSGALPETVALVFESGLRVTLPLARAFDVLRPLSGAPELQAVQRTLREPASPPVEPWSRRHRATRDKVAAGQATALAEVVRDGLRREQRLASGRMTAPSDRQLYVQARTLLTAEVALCRGVGLAEADTWILDQVAEQPLT